jgi:peptidoglycan/LPS O-acetylase OafA/YrhL
VGFINLDFWYYVHSPVALSLFTLSNLSFIGIDFGHFTCVQLIPLVEFAFNWSRPCPDGQLRLLSGAVVPPAWTLSLEWYFYLLAFSLAAPKIATCRSHSLRGCRRSSRSVAFLRTRACRPVVSARNDPFFLSPAN